MCKSWPTSGRSHSSPYSRRRTNARKEKHKIFKLRPYLVVDETAASIDDSDHLVLLDLGSQGIFLLIQILLVRLFDCSWLLHDRVWLDVLVLHIHACQEELLLLDHCHNVVLSFVVLLSFVILSFVLIFKCADCSLVACLPLRCLTIDSAL